MTQKLKFPPSMSDHPPFEVEPHRIWVSSSLTLQRNLGRYKFPAKLSLTDAKTVLNISKAFLEQSPEIKGPVFFPAEKLTPFEKEFLFEHFLCPESFQNALTNQGFLVDNSGQFLAILNLKNHIQFHWVDFSSDLAKAWERLSKIETDFGKQLAFAFSPKFGYLTSDKAECGTALHMALYLHLPALIHSHQLSEALAKQKDEDLVAVGLEGSLDELVGDIIVLKNQYTLGLSEETILHELQTTALRLIASEKTMRTHLKEKGSPEIKDLVGRAYGLLVHSYQLQTKEAMSALSLIKLGIELEWIKGSDAKKIDHAIFHCRRAHLAHTLNEPMSDPNTLNLRRAAFIHKALEGMILP
jgi:protein arginine kinase